MIKASLPGAALAVLLTSSAAAAPARPEASAWVVTPLADACRTELELTGASGAAVNAALLSDGAHLTLRFARQELPEQAFLPIRIDQKPFANLMLRTADGKAAEMQLSAESQAALRKGSTLQIGWLAQELVSASLAGSEQGLADLRTCGAQVAARFREQQAAQHDTQARAEAAARAEALADEQLAAAKAQRLAAEAETQRSTAEAERLRAAAEAERERARAEADAARQRAAQQAEIEDYPGPTFARRYSSPDPRDLPPQPRYPAYEPSEPYRPW